MREQSEKLLRIACALLAALLVFQIARVVVRSNPLAHAKFPALPTLTTSVEGQPVAKGTKTPTAEAGRGSNVLASASRQTNALASQPVSSARDTNAVSQTVPATATNLSVSTNIAASATNQTADPASVSSNTASQVQGKLGTNAIPPTQPGAKGAGPPSRPEVAGGPINFPGAPGMAQKAPQPPPEILARIDRVVDSEILGPVMRPLPMALLGIAGNMAFLRASSGQMGAVKEGDELGGLKLVRIGINRVLVEEKGEKKELTIFSGLGSESLLSK